MTKLTPEQKKQIITLRGANRLAISAKEPEVMLSGSADTGKTVTSCTKLHLICLRYPGAQCAIVRKSQNSLTGSVLATWAKVTKGGGYATLGGTVPKRYQYSNGSTIWLGGMDNSDKVLSSERDFIYVNQAEELALNDWEILSTRCSGRGAVIKNPQLFGDCNPSSSKHWIRERAKAGKLRLLVSTHKDNPSIYDAKGNLTPSGKKRLEVLDNLTGVRRLRLRDGIWATAEGAVYEMFNPEQTGQLSDHVQVRPREEMGGFYFALDDGFTNPAVILDIGFDSDRRWHVFREIFKRGWTQEDTAEKAREWNLSRRVELAAVDEAAAGLVEALKRKGINALPGKGKIFDGIAKIQARLKVQKDGRPRLTIDPSCIELINEFESYIWKPEKDVPVDEFNHGVGALRYLADVLNEPSPGFQSVSDLIVPEVETVSKAEELEFEELTFDDDEL